MTPEEETYFAEMTKRAAQLQPVPPMPPDPDRATYLATRSAERERIRALDQQCRDDMSWVTPLLKDQEETELNPHPEYEDFQENGVRLRSLHDHYCHVRKLNHVVEDYLLGFPVYPWETGPDLVRGAPTTDELIASLLRLEDDMIDMFGAPWKD
jgi:hypothetical protein